MIINSRVGQPPLQARSCAHCHEHEGVAPPSDGLGIPRERDPGLMQVSPGVVPLSGGPALNARQAAQLSSDLAHQAASMGTFGVGGVLLGLNHEVLATSRNCVVEGTQVKDPTAHGERQLVDWYFQQVKNGVKLPPPAELTIVSSLDPCAMCAGAILAAGIKVAVLAPDTFAGVDFKQDSQFTSMPANLSEKARHQFAYLGIEGGRAYAGDSAGLYAGAAVPAEVEKSSLDIFGGSLETVKAKINSAGGDVAQLSDPLPVELAALLRKFDPLALSVKTDPVNPGVELAPLLLGKAKRAQEQGSAFNAAALVDRNGQVLLTVGGQEAISPTRTAFMELTRTWARIRDEAGAEGQQHLPAFKHCRLVSLQGPASDATSFMEMGAYGSSVEGPVPEGTTWQYVLPRQSSEATARMVADLPPLYSQVIKPEIHQVASSALIDACSRA